MNKTIQDFQIDLLSEINKIHNNRCKHENAQGSENWDNLKISFCRNCGTNIITYYGKEDQRTWFISPYDVWKLFNYKFNIMEQK